MGIASEGPHARVQADVRRISIGGRGKRIRLLLLQSARASERGSGRRAAALAGAGVGRGDLDFGAADSRCLLHQPTLIGSRNVPG